MGATSKSLSNRNVSAKNSRQEITRRRHENIFAIRTGATLKGGGSRISDRMLNLVAIGRNAVLEKIDIVSDLIEFDFKSVSEMYSASAQRDYLNSLQGKTQDELFEEIQRLGTTL